MRTSVSPWEMRYSPATTSRLPSSCTCDEGEAEMRRRSARGQGERPHQPLPLAVAQRGEERDAIGLRLEQDLGGAHVEEARLWRGLRRAPAATAKLQAPALLGRVRAA